MHKRILLAAMLAAAAVVCPVRPVRATVNSPSNTFTYVGNGATTAYTVPFKFLQNSDIVVTVAGVTKTLGSDFTLSGAGNPTGTITFSTAPANSASIVITRVVDYLQKTSLRSQRSYDASSVEGAIDKLSMGQQQLQALFTNPPASVLPSNTVAKLNNIRFADQFANIQAAITDAGTTGAVIIPPGYVGVDTYSNPSLIPILDLRGQSSLRGYIILTSDFGAVGDNATDSTSKLQSAINAAAAAKATLIVPKGDFKNTAEITLPSNTHIMGFGIESHLFWSGSAINSGLKADGATDVVIEGLFIEGKTSPSNALTRCIQANGVTRLTVRNNKFTGCGAADRAGGYRAAISTDGTDIAIDDNYFIGNGPGTVGADSHEINFTPTPVPSSWTVMTQRAFVRRNRIVGNTSNLSIAVHDAYDVEVSGNYVDQNNTRTINNSGYGIMFYNNASVSTLANAVKRVRTENNYVTNTAGIGIYLAGVVDGVVTGNFLKDVVKQQLEVDLAPAGITVNQFFTPAVSGGVTVVANSIDTTQQAGIACVTCVGESIVANVIQFPVVYGIDVRTSSTDTTVVGNTIIGNGTGTPTGIQARTSSTRITVDGNSIQGMLNGINFVGINDNLAVNNRVNGSTGHGIQASSTSTRNLIARNWVTSSTGFGVAEGSATNYYVDNLLIGNTAGPFNLNTGSMKKGNITTSGGQLRGTVTLAAANPAATVSVGEVRTGDQIRVNRQTVGGTPGHLSIGTITNLTSFTIVASGNLDTSLVEWEIVH